MSTAQRATPPPSLAAVRPSESRRAPAIASLAGSLAAWAGFPSGLHGSAERRSSPCTPAREHQHSTPRREAACGIEEARLFIETALKRYEKKRKPILLPAVMTLTMGLRACEILKRQVRDLDDGCGILWIDQGKTHNARRHLRIPEFLRPLLQELIKGKGPESFLFPSELSGQSVRRQRLWAVVQDICKEAGVTRVCVHSLSGLYATLDVESGALFETVAASLGTVAFP